jgi:phosphoserine phosphatase RsbU/P
MTAAPSRPTVGVLVDRLDDEYQNQLFTALDTRARARDVNLICICGGVLDAPGQHGRERNFAFDVIAPAVLDALIVMSGPISNHVGAGGVAALCRRFAPLPACSIGVRLEGMPNVLIDNASGLERSIGGLLESGRRRIAFLRGPEQNQEAEIRYRAYARMLERHGLAFDPELVVVGDFHKESGARAISTLIDERRQRFDALVAASDHMALGAIDELLARNISVPEQVAVSGFDDVEDSRFAPVPLSTVRQPLREQAERALDLLLDRVPSGSERRDVILNTEVVIRASCGLLDAPRLKPANDEADAEYEQARERLRQARQLRALRRSGQALSSALDEEQVLAALARELPGIGIARSLICLFGAEQQPDGVRRICTSAASVSSAQAQPVPLTRVLERQTWQGDQRYTAVLEPLSSSAGPHGLAVFEVGPAQGMVYEFLREQISAALGTAKLLQRLVNETARRLAVEKEQRERERR